MDTAAGFGELNPNPPSPAPNRKTGDAKDLSRVGVLEFDAQRLTFIDVHG
jgi:hypothetical protein